MNSRFSVALGLLWEFCPAVSITHIVYFMGLCCTLPVLLTIGDTAVIIIRTV